MSHTPASGRMRHSNTRTRSRWVRHAYGIVALALALTAPARAHDRSTSYSSWELHGRDARVVVRVTELELSHFPWAQPGSDYDERAGRYLSSQLQLLADQTPCSPRSRPRRLAAAAGRVAYEWKVQCPPDGSLQIRTGLFLDVAPSHLHFARLREGSGQVQERVLSEADRTWTISEAAPSQQHAGGTSLTGYLALGVEHILSGYDHLAFVLALILLGSSLAEVARVVTGFTVAHSLTLGLTVLGYVQPDNAPVEALIGLSIFLVAAENAWMLGGRPWTLPAAIAVALLGLGGLAGFGHGQVPALTLGGLALFSAAYFALLRRLDGNTSLRWAVAFLFGLIHGFGFAAVLGEAGLPAERIVPALLGFNLGVELGQLAVVALVWPLLRLLQRGSRKELAPTVAAVGSAAIAGLGLFWFVSRSFG